MKNAHRLGELRSLAYHARVAERLRADPSILAVARARAAEWCENRPRHATGAGAWLALIDGDFERLLAILVSDDERGRELRQSSPFAGMLSPEERWALWSAVRNES
jgi:hypothetical protein